MGVSDIGLDGMEAEKETDPLLCAAEAGDVQRLRELLDDGYNINSIGKFGWNALHVACWHWQIPAALYLCSRGIDASVVDDCGRTALHMIAGGHEMGLITAILQAGGDPTLPCDKSGWQKEFSLPHEKALKNGWTDEHDVLLAAHDAVLYRRDMEQLDDFRRRGAPAEENIQTSGRIRIRRKSGMQP